MDNIKEHQETPVTTTDTKRTMETSEKELEVDTSEEEVTEFTQAPINVLAQIEMDNSPLEELWINTKTNISQKLAIQETVDKKEKTLEEMVPMELLDYKDVFNKVTAEQFPESRPWDHTIDLKEDFVPSDCKVYPMTLPEQAELDKFIDKNLAKGYIHQTLEITYGIAILLCLKEGWKIMTLPGLPETKQRHNQEQLPTTAHIDTIGQAQRHKVLHKVGPQIRIQQHTDQRWRPMEGSIQNQQRTI